MKNILYAMTKDYRSAARAAREAGYVLDRYQGRWVLRPATGSDELFVGSTVARSGLEEPLARFDTLDQVRYYCRYGGAFH